MDEELLRIFRVPRAMLPEVLPSSTSTARREERARAELPIAGNRRRPAGRALRQACHEAGMAKNTYGTGCFLLLTPAASDRVAQRTDTTCAAQAGAKQFALEGSVFTGGAVVQWLRDGLHLIRKSVDIEKLAASVPDSGGVYLVPAFTGLGAPHWIRTRAAPSSSHARIERRHIARAALESIASSRRICSRSWNRTPARNRKNCASTVVRGG